MNKVVVVRLDWRSLDGFAEYRPVYSDGTVGRIRSTQISLDDPKPKLAGAKATVEREWIGKEKDPYRF